MLEISKFNKIIVANWKLNGSFDFIQSYFTYINSIDLKKDVCGIICSPFVYLDVCNKQSKSIYIGAQDCSNFKSGAFTGDISALMLRNINSQFCLVGHSERRVFFNQKNEDVRIKANNLLDVGINPIVCIGETLDEKERGKTEEALKKQIIESIPQGSSNNSIIIAYEPIWAIGTGLTPKIQDIDKIHTFLKKGIKNYKNFKILYGGSVKSSNAEEIMSLENVDGLLVGGSSLDPVEFSKILQA
jgi:triosephosphate isomerase